MKTTTIIVTTLCTAFFAAGCNRNHAGGEGNSNGSTSTPQEDSEGGTETGETEKICEPGMSIDCACTNGQQGMQPCSPDGQSFQECICEGGSGSESGGLGDTGEVGGETNTTGVMSTGGELESGTTMPMPEGFCGDSHVDPGEECDDGNVDDTDNCLTLCHHASCGDGIVHANFEQCDDANQDDADSCTNDCQFQPSDIEVVITGDNAYAFGYGGDDSLNQYYGGVEAVTAGQIFNCGEGPEKYLIPAADAKNATSLYIIAWDDSFVTNGVIGAFRRTNGNGGFGQDVYTGTKGWEACATGAKYDIGSGGPPMDVINQHIVACNNGITPSGGWVDDIGTALGAVALGEDNTTEKNGGPAAGNEFQIVCPADMPGEAHWMWFNWDPAHVVPPSTPFIFPGGDNPYHQFLIFRLNAEKLPEPQ